MILRLDLTAQKVWRFPDLRRRRTHTVPEVVPAVVPLVFVGGGSARTPLPVFGNLGMAMAGLRTYALTLNAALAEKGVHSAFYTVAGMIVQSRIEVHIATRDERLKAKAMAKFDEKERAAIESARPRSPKGRLWGLLKRRKVA